MKALELISTTLLLLVIQAVNAGESVQSEAEVSPEKVALAVEQAHNVLWSKFIGDDGLIHDYVGELPTPEDCEQGRPNAIGWWSPIENGPMFTGFVSRRHLRTGPSQRKCSRP